MPVTVASLQAVLDLNKDSFDRGLKGVDKALNKMANLATGAVVAGGAAAAGAIAGIGVAAFNMEKDLDTATAKLATDLGISKDAAKDFEDTMVGVFKNNFGNDFEDIGDAIGQVTKRFGRLEKQELKDTTERILAIRDAFDKDFNEVADAAAVLMKEFGLTSQESLDFVAKGLQEIPADDLLDTIREYGNQFGQAGFDAAGFFSTLQTGTAGGVLGTDKMADAFKEFNLRFLEGSDEVMERIETLTGDSWSMFVQEIEAGDSTISDVLGNVLKNLQAIEDPIERNRIGVGLFGTQWEDLGEKAFLALDLQETKMADIGGATDALGEQYNTLADRVEGVKRRFEVALLPLGGLLVDSFEAALPAIENFFDQIEETELPELITVIKEFNDSFNKLLETLGLINEEAGGFDLILKFIQGSLIVVRESLDGWDFAMRLVIAQIERFKLKVDILKGALNNLGDSLPDWLTPGSPTPLELGLMGINKAFDKLPDVSQNIGGLASAAGVTGSGTSNVTVNIAGVSATTNTTGDANNEAIRLTLQLLRAQLEAAG